MASEIAGKEVFNPTSAHSIVVEALEKKRSSEALARRIWMSFVVEGNDALYRDDVREVLGPARQDDADEAFDAIDVDGNGDISLDEMIMKVVEIGTDRKAIASSMNDIGQAIAVFDQVLFLIAFIIAIFVYGKLLCSPAMSSVSAYLKIFLNLAYVSKPLTNLLTYFFPKFSCLFKPQLYHNTHYGWNHPPVTVLHLCRYCARIPWIMHLPLRQTSI